MKCEKKLSFKKIPLPIASMRWMMIDEGFDILFLIKNFIVRIK